MSKKRWSVLGLALGTLVLGLLVGLMTVGTVAADPSPGVRIQIPRVDKGNLYGTVDWETWIQVQNVSHITDTGAIFFGWSADLRLPKENPGDPDPKCPPNDDGPFVVYCQLIRGNALWTLRSQLDEDIKSAIVYSVPAGPDGANFQAACDKAYAARNSTQAWLKWETDWAAPGEELAVTVSRYGGNAHGSFVSSTYIGISEEMEGMYAPGTPPYEYYAPYVMKGYHGLDTELTIQNSGDACTSIWIDYLPQGSCSIVYKQHIEQLGPGEAIKVRVPTVPPWLVCGYLGSAHITAEQPLGVIVDQTSFDEPCYVYMDPGTLLTHRARAHKEMRNGVEIQDTKVYADLIFREWSGWSSSIQVQNLSRTGQYTFVTVDFMDNGGDEILFVADWVCPTGSATFYLPAIASLGPNPYVGAAEIESHDQINYPGDKTDAQPIFAVVDLKKERDPAMGVMYAQGGSYNAHPYSQKKWVDEIALPFMAKSEEGQAVDPADAWNSIIAIRNNSNCNKIRPKIWFKDETGRVLCEINTMWLRPKQMTIIDLTKQMGCLYPGYIGSAKVVIEPEDVEQLCDKDNDGHADNLPTMPSVIVVSKGQLGLPGMDGDITRIYEGIPYSTGDKHCDADLLGTVIDSRTKEPVPVDAEGKGAKITVSSNALDYNAWADYHELAGRWVYTYTDAVGWTGYGGMFEIEDIVTLGTLEPAGTCYTVTVSLDDYQSSVIPNVCLHCGEDKVLNVQLVSLCNTVTVSGTVEDKETGAWLAGVTVTATNAEDAKTATTDATGHYTITDLAFDPDSPINVAAELTGYNRALESTYIPECGGIAVVSFQLHDEPMSRILLYYGNGGIAPTIPEPAVITGTHEYYNAQNELEALGHIVDYTNVWPSDPDLEEYKVIFLLGLGNTNDDDPSDNFTPAQVTQLDHFLRNGGRLVIMTDADATLGVENLLLVRLGLDVGFEDWATWIGNHIDNAVANQITADDQLTEGVATLDFDTATDLVVAAGAAPGLLAELPATHSTDPGADMLAADTMPGVDRLPDYDPVTNPNPGFAGDVVLIGDLNWMDDDSYLGSFNWPADNENLLSNIVDF